MNKTLETSTPKFLTYAQQLTNTNLFPMFQETSEEHPTYISPLTFPFTIYEHSLSTFTPSQSVGWLWDRRLPLSGITILDGDHGCGKSLLALQIAAAVSSGTPLPDGTPTIEGGVVIISANTDATTTQFQLLSAFGADLTRVEILSYVQEPTSSPHAGDARPFSLPEDFPRLFQAIQRVDARLVILDPFISLLSRERRWTELRLSHLLADLNQRLIERNVACLLIRNCTAKGGHARPPLLERSDFFLITAVSRLLLAHDPMQPDRLLLCHAHSRHSALQPTLILQIQPQPISPILVHISVQGTHQLSARDFIEHRPDTLHRRLLFQHLQTIIADTTDPIHVSTLYTQSPHSSPFQIQRTLNDLLRMGQIERPARGFYAKAPANPVFPTPESEPEPETDADYDLAAQEAHARIKAERFASIEQEQEASQDDATSSGHIKFSRFWTHFQRQALADEETRELFTKRTNALDETAATNPTPEPENELNTSAATTQTPEPTNELNASAATTQTPEPTDELNTSAAITQTPEPTDELNASAATTPISDPTNELNASAATTQTPEPTNELNTSAATTSVPEWKKQLDAYIAKNMTPELTQGLDETGRKLRAQM